MQDSLLALEEAGWILSPDLPPGIRLQLSTVIEAEQLTPEVFELLGKAMMELQTSEQTEEAVAARRVTCPKLRSCDNYVGGCPYLNKCGNYALKVTAS